MRALAPVGVLVASGFLQQSTAQVAGYGRVSISLAVTAHCADQDSRSPDIGSGADSYGEPDNAPRNGASATIDGLPAGSPGGPTCVAQGTTTVFVTVYPTSPVSPAGGSLSAAGGPKQTAHHTLNPTRTIRVSPFGHSQATRSSVSPFTTITVDLWGHGADAGDKSGEAATGAGSGSPAANDASPSSHPSSAGAPAGYGEDSGASWPQPAATIDSVGSDGDSAGTVAGGALPSPTSLRASPDGSLAPYGPSNPAPGSPGSGRKGADGVTAWPTVVTDTEVHWVLGSEGPTPVTILSEHTIFATGAAQAPAGGEVVTCVTNIGPDGHATVLEWPAGAPQGNGGPAVSTVAGLPNDQGSLSPQAVSTAISPPSPLVTALTSGGVAAPDGGASTTCTTYTVLGADGVPTVVHSSWVVPHTGPFTVASGPLPTDASGPVQSQNGPNGPGITTCTSYTLLGADGRPTAVESTFVLPGPANTQAGAPGNAAGGVPVQVTQLPGPVQSGVAELPEGGLTTCTTFTVLGANGLPTVVETTYVVPSPDATPLATYAPGGVITGAPSQITGSPGNPQPENAGAAGITTCITYTAIGADGKPTIVESTVVMPASDALPTGVSPFSLPGGPITTCITVEVFGPNGVPTPVVETVVLTPAGARTVFPAATTIGRPSMVPQQQTNLPQGIPPFASNGAVTTCITVDVVGPNGVATPVVQTIVFTPSATGLGSPAAPSVANAAGLPAQSFGPLGQGGSLNTAVPGVPSLDAYGAAVPDLQTILPPSGVVSGLNVETPGAAGDSGLPFPYGSSSGDLGALGSGAGEPAPNAYGWSTPDAGLYGLLSAPSVPQGRSTLTTLRTLTWTNFIPEPTTTFTMNFPLTTLETVTVSAPFYPQKRAFRRQESFSLSSSAWSNASVAVPTVSTSAPPEVTPAPAPQGASVSVLFPPTTSQVLPGAPSGPSAMCSSGGKIGNTTVNFDDVKPGPLFNPSGDIWFSEGFLVAPPASQAAQSYLPSSGGQLVEFVPASLANPSASHQGTGDAAEVGVGPNAASPCFRFDFFGAQLGCAAAGNEEWCEFEVSAYTFNEGLSFEQSIAWSETKRVPACPSFANGNCPLTPVDFVGYKNITSILVTLRVGIELRAWWGDDFKFGWTDNSCEAASCRASATPQHVKRETVELALRRGVWHWTPAGLQRLDDEYIWDSVY
ncbi:protein family CysZ [Hirsutella rhossiliensis]|uniref:Protein family CysZ n=1 Tax=Hirsutella rhossiliensis TaxID=111463 RepID=A0A9P8SEW9_9HYPO|nr:protein family CysZ [Hirsutella rhossiliensis]KAH0960258.1 protein family CysZ [Hirsutella rhossiliensis]